MLPLNNKETSHHSSLLWLVHFLRYFEWLGFWTGAWILLNFSLLLQTLTTARRSRGVPRRSQCLWARPWMKLWWTCRHPLQLWSVTVARTPALSATSSSRWLDQTPKFDFFFKNSFSQQILRCLPLSSYLFFLAHYMGCSVEISKTASKRLTAF